MSIQASLFSRTARFGTISAISLCVALAGCDGGGSGTGGAGGTGGGGTGGTGGGTGGTGGGVSTEDCTVILSPGDSDQSTIQTALIEAKEGDVICFAEGTFKLNTELSLDVASVTLRGAGADKTTWDFSAQDVGANGLLIKSDGVTVEHLTVLNTPGDGIRADSVVGISFLNMAVVWEAEGSETNGAYGLYPVGSSNVLIDGCTVTGARDAGVYVGQSSNIIISNNDVYGNVAGIEVENSTDSEVMGNHVHGNTGGILAFNLPGLPVKDGKRANIHDNLVEENNHKNFGEPGTAVAKVPYGVGIMILASDDNEVHNNEIKNNVSVGVLIVSYLEMLFGLPNDPEFNSFPEGNFTHDNTFEANGEMPNILISGAAGGIKPIPDVVWDGCVDPAAVDDGHLTNCISGNKTSAGADSTYANADLCSDPQMVSTDAASVTCTYDPLPPQK